MRWLRIPSGVLDLRPALGGSIWLYLHITRLARKDGTVPEWSDLAQARMLGLSRWAVRDARRKLRRYGLITEARSATSPRLNLRVVIPQALTANPSQAPRPQAPPRAPRKRQAPQPLPLPQAPAPAPGAKPWGGDQARWESAWRMVIPQVVGPNTRPQVRKAMEGSELVAIKGGEALVRVAVSAIDEIAGTSWLQQFLSIRCGRLLAAELGQDEEVPVKFIGPGEE